MTESPRSARPDAAAPETMNRHVVDVLSEHQNGIL